jgi:competence protein ComEA
VFLRLLAELIVKGAVMIEERLEFIKTNWRYFAIGLLMLLVCGGGYYWYHQQQVVQEKQLIAAATRSSHRQSKTAVSSSSSALERAFVYVAGAVRHPGLYPISRQMRWADVVQSAGGLSKDADVSSINLAKIAKDQENLTVPTKGASSAPVATGSAPVAATSSAASSGSTMIDLNSATPEQLQTISGVGPKRAQDIIDYRDQHGGFKKVAELKEISGIGDKIFADIEPKVTVGP